MINIQDKDYYSISEVNDYIKLLFDNTITLKGIGLEGEISNFKGKNYNGHLYFSLKDEKCSINAVMFKYDTMSLNFEPKNGDKVLVIGSISSYPPSGTYQIICKKIIPYGQGDILLKKEMLKQKLSKEGYFDEDRKKEIPSYPNSIAVITGKNSAASHDFEYNLLRRYPLVTIKFYYCFVQGEEAPKDIVRALDEAEKAKHDLILLGRGGGASEDLNAFDDENVVKTIYNLKTPIITAIGHEINLSLADLVADKHASTPTGACEYAVPDINEIEEDLKQQLFNFKRIITQNISTYEIKLANIHKLNFLRNYEGIYDSYLLKLNQIKTSVDTRFLVNIKNIEMNFKEYKGLINNLNPTSILKKGYSIVYDESGRVINNINKVKTNQLIDIQLANGKIKAEVKEK